MLSKNKKSYKIFAHIKQYKVYIMYIMTLTRDLKPTSH